MSNLRERLADAFAGRYTLERTLGQGGMATVFEARDLKHGRSVALKVLSPELASRIGPDRFLREIRVTARLTHPHILPLHDSGEADGLLWYTMPLVVGDSLRDRIENDRQLPVDEVSRLVEQVASALDRAHARGIVHRDIKPENILLDGQSALVTDFGIAGITGDPDQKGLTTTGLAIGTGQYMSPEQVAADKVDARADVYSLACVAYEALAGRPVFTGVTAESIARQHLTTDPVPLTTLRSALPPAIDDVFRRALAKTPDDRFPSAREFSVAFHKALLATAPARGTRVSWLFPSLLVLAAVATVTVAVLLLLRPGGGYGPSGPVRSVAVLPFDNLSGDDDQAVFVDGIHDALVAELSRVSAFERVAQRTSVLRFASSTLPLAHIADSLNVGALVTGTVLPAEGRVRVNVSLVEAANERNLWSQTYLEDVEDVLTLQRVITSNIAREIELSLTPEEQAHLAEETPIDGDALFAYQRGRQLWNERLESSLTRAIEYFDQAVEIDSTFAAAHAARSDTYNMLLQYGFLSTDEAIGPQRDAAERAIRWDPTSPEAHMALAEVSFVTGEWARAEEAFERAISLGPNSAGAHHFYGWFLSHLGRHEQGIRRAARAVELDPASASANANLAAVYINARRYEEARGPAARAIEIQPDHTYGLFVSMLVAMHDGDRDRAIELGYRHRESMSGTTATHSFALAWAGEREEAARLLAQHLDERGGLEGYPDFLSFEVAGIYVLLDDVEEALRWIERGVDRGVGAGGHPLKVWPHFDPLRDDPRFQELLDRMGYPE